MTEKFPKIQVQSRLEQLKVPADKLTWRFMTMTPEDIEEAIENGNWLGAIENPNAPKAQQARTKFKLTHADGFDDMTPVNFFDYAVLAVCATAYKEGWQGLTLNQICRVLTHAKSWHMSDAVKTAVEASIKRMMSTVITIDLTDTAEKMRYKFKRTSITSPVLPCQIEDWEINGQKSTYVKFLGESPLMEVAEAKNHILTVGTKLLDIAGLRSSKLSIESKWYLVFLALGKKQHQKYYGQTILFQSLYEYTGTANQSKCKRKRIRDEFLRILEKMKAEGELDFEIVMDGNIFKAIKIL